MSGEITDTNAAAEPLPVDCDGLAIGEQEESDRVIRRSFRLGELSLLLPEDTVCEIMDMPPIARIPNTALWLLGLANRRTQIVPVFDLAHLLLGVSWRNGRGSRLLVIGQGDAVAGTIVEELPTLQTFGAEQRAEQPLSLPAALTPYLTDCFVKDGVHWFEFDHEKFFYGLVDKVAVT